ncbi:Ldh family oxidoreductase (plasmid) [Sinorhizobium medicae]|uniref:Ldh family oxidoreductase n=1 Tax=Sinorhizobium medicae TaxID=110321 RepID=UPI000FDCA82C|nr:Ldh family oxidoreductase [Sinorhizobium medicae]MBO1965613.1 Ldh family oxidoreductase [Sinorhizobium medicae]RVJ67842.1 Ldh family oxidoreductase [Sinorhizobium medicae]WQO54897.1 Ldh family oxidoreductase [Sinorhizobium medicae]
MPSVEKIRSAALAALRNAGVSDVNAEIQLSLLLEAELRGVASHGLLRLPRVVDRIANGATNPATTGKHVWRGDALLEVDGEQGLGPVVAMAALDEVSLRAEKTGVATAAIRNCDHLGMLAWYAEHIAGKGQVLIALTVSEALVHPWGGRRAMLGTNPIAIGIPADPHPFVFDMATSLVSMGKIHDYANRREPIPGDWALDADGNPTTNASAAKFGAIAPFGGAKGYALGLAFELLVTSLAGSAIGPDVKGTLDAHNPCNKGDLFIVLKPANGMATVISRFMEDIRNSEPSDPTSPVRIPGDRALHTRAQRLNQEIQLADEVWTRIQILAEKNQPSAERGDQ